MNFIEENEKEIKEEQKITSPIVKVSTSDSSYNSKNNNFLNEPILEDIYEINREKSEQEAKKNKKNKVLKYAIYLTIILTITGLVIYFNLFFTSKPGEEPVYKKIPLLFEGMGTREWWFFGLFIGLVILSFFVTSLILFLFARLYTRRYKYHQAFANTLIGTFYSNITPGSSGGQFAQAYTFKKQGLPLSTSASILVMSYIVYQSTLIVCGLISMVRISDIIEINTIPISIGDFNIPLPVGIFVIGGFILNALIISLLFIMSYSRKFHSFILNHGINFLAKIKLVKNPDEKRESVRNQVENFRIELRRLQSNIPFTILIVLLCFCSIYISTSIPCVCGYALGGFNSSTMSFQTFIENTFTCFCYMNFHQMMTGLIPIPGSAGVSEFVFSRIFSKFFTAEFISNGGLNLVTLLWRFGTFYIPFIICGFVAALYQSRGLKGVDRFYSVGNSKKTFLTIQIQTYDERKYTSDLQYAEEKARFKGIINNRAIKKENKKIQSINKLNNDIHEIDIGIGEAPLKKRKSRRSKEKDLK